MTAWQDQQTRGGADGSRDASKGAPMSRREAREAERRAAEAVAERQPHPSGVVDFEAHDFGSEFAPDQEFNVGDTQDIWAALTRAGRTGPQATTGTGDVRPGAPETPAAQRRDDSSVNGELLDRVRDAVLRRAPEAPAAPAPAARAVAPQQPEAFQQPTFSAPAAFSAVPDLDAGSGLTRRQRREQQIADQREDGLPSELFTDRHRPESGPQPVQPQGQAGFEGYDYEDDGYYDEPYLPEPTIAIARQATEPAAPSYTTNPIGLPNAFAEPAGDDALTFSSPVPVAPAERRDQWAAAQVDPAFIQPQRGWAASDEDVDDDQDDDELQGYQPRSYTPGPIPAPPATPFVPQQSPFQAAQFQSPQLGPPSEVTDLAGFEALIRKARQQPQAPEPLRTGPTTAWADDQEEVQEGFTGLLSRSVQGSHGSANALILPNDPQPDLTQAVSANGDIFITGSMNLPRSLSTTGASSDLYDSPEIDRLYEASQDEPAAGVAPVRASRAVSGAPHDRGFKTGPRRRGNVLPTVLAIVAGAMAVGVVTLLVGSWVLQLF
jgi:hypothetical protein